MRCLESTPDDYNLSPEQIQSLKMRIYHSQSKSLGNPNYDAQKSDVFSLGLVALQMGTLSDLKSAYDLNNYAILPDQITKLLDT